MASGCSARLFSVDEVVAELDIPGPVVDDEEWSDDEFDGYTGGQEEDRRDNELHRVKEKSVMDWSLGVNVK